MMKVAETSCLVVNLITEDGVAATSLTFCPPEKGQIVVVIRKLVRVSVCVPAAPADITQLTQASERDRSDRFDSLHCCLLHQHPAAEQQKGETSRHHSSVFCLVVFTSPPASSQVKSSEKLERVTLPSDRHSSSSSISSSCLVMSSRGPE